MLSWTFHPNAVFERFNAFLERLNTIQWFFSTVIEFLKLEKVEIGGLKGRQLSLKITTIYADFNQFFSSFAAKTYDVLDPDDLKFMQDFEIFQQRILELDIKLAGIFCQAFNDCHCLESAFKLINILGSVLERPKISAAFTDNYLNLLQMLATEMRHCEKIYQNQMKHLTERGYLLIDRRFPTLISGLKWANQLSARITAPVNSFKALQHSIAESNDAHDLYRRYDELMRLLGAFQEKIFNEWAAKIPNEIEINLKKSLISQSSDKSLYLNFDQKLFGILREVYHLKVMEWEQIPDEGLKFAENNDLYLNFTLNLEESINWYNDVGLHHLAKRKMWKIIQKKTKFFSQIVQKSTAVELTLIQTEIEEIDRSIAIGVNDLCWNSQSICKKKQNFSSNPKNLRFFISDIMEYLIELRKPVERLQIRMQKTQSNLSEIKRITSMWLKQPLFIRKDGKKDSVLCLNERENRVTKRYTEIELASNSVHR